MRRIYGSAAGDEPMPSLSAVRRLERIKEHQESLWKEFSGNWQGWLGSALLHGAVFILFAALGYTVMQEKQEYWLETDLLQTSDTLTKESLDQLFEDSTVQSDVDKLPEAPADVQRPYAGYNELEPGAPPWLTSGGHLIGIGGGGGGGDELAGIGWRGHLRGIQRTGLEVMFVFDSTGSMGGIILEVKTRIRTLMRVVTFLVPNARVGFVTYRDKKRYDLDDYEYTVKYVPLVKGDKEGLGKLSRFLHETEAYGGGDIPEAVYEGVEAAIQKAEWSAGTKKVIIVFGDAPPRPENNGLSRIYDLCRKWKEEGNVISCIDTTGGSKLLDEFKQMAADGGGEATFLNDDRAIIRQLVIQVFGSKWQKPLDEAIKTVLQGPDDTVIGE